MSEFSDGCGVAPQPGFGAAWVWGWRHSLTAATSGDRPIIRCVSQGIHHLVESLPLATCLELSLVLAPNRPPQTCVTVLGTTVDRAAAETLHRALASDLESLLPGWERGEVHPTYRHALWLERPVSMGVPRHRPFLQRAVALGTPVVLTIQLQPSWPDPELGATLERTFRRALRHPAALGRLKLVGDRLRDPRPWATVRLLAEEPPTPLLLGTAAHAAVGGRARWCTEARQFQLRDLTLDCLVGNLLSAGTGRRVPDEETASELELDSTP